MPKCPWEIGFNVDEVRAWRALKPKGKKTSLGPKEFSEDFEMPSEIKEEDEMRSDLLVNWPDKTVTQHRITVFEVRQLLKQKQEGNRGLTRLIYHKKGGMVVKVAPQSGRPCLAILECEATKKCCSQRRLQRKMQ